MVSDLTLYHDKATGLDYAGDLGETTPVSWKPRGTLAYEEWIAIGNTLQQVNASLNWWIGDWMNYGEKKWGEMYAQAVEVTGWDYQRLANAKWVSARIPFSTRVEKLTWTHHREVATLEPEVQIALLLQAEREGWSVRRLREEIKGPQMPAPALSLSEPEEVPFNHRPRVGIPASERTAVDEYEQETPLITNSLGSYYLLPHDTKQCAKCNNLWIADLDYCPYCHIKPELRAHYAEKEETIYTNGTHGMSVHFSSDSPEHYTPTQIVDAVVACLGTIDLDPCSNSKTDPNVPAMHHYTQEDDGLSQVWAGRVYMNPPYGREIGKWVAKLREEYDNGNVTEAIALVPARTDTDWFDCLIDGFKFHCFVHGRLTFIGNTESAPFPSAIVYLGNDWANFYSTFRSFGRIVQETNPEMFGA